MNPEFRSWNPYQGTRSLSRQSIAN